MATNTTAPKNLREFNADVDENGQRMSAEPTDLARPDELRRVLASDPGGEAEAARTASGQAEWDGIAATEAEVPPGTIEKLGDASLGAPKQGEPAAEESVERATSSLGKK